jgi:hypothetical protein
MLRSIVFFINGSLDAYLGRFADELMLAVKMKVW